MSQFLPAAPDLLAAVAGVLDEVLASAPPHLQHEVRVAANLTRIVERELRAGPAPELSDPTDWEQLVAVTRHDLSISKPGYDHWTAG